MPESSNEWLRDADLEDCAHEPIHTPGQIQPHGIFLAVSEPDLIIQFASTNTESVFGAPANVLLGQSLRDHLTTERLNTLLQALKADNFRRVNPLKLDQYDLILTRSEGLLFLEFEEARAENRPESSSIYQQINVAIAEIEQSSDLFSLCQIAAEQVKELSGYDRVMVYQFDEQWNGRVVAEAKEATQEPFLGLHYPASDIPAQARALYHRNWLRIIPDVNYQPQEILSHSSKPSGRSLDLSDSVLRSVSPVHLQYLKNMGVGASMSVSIIKDEKLWGLIACHHSSGAYLSFEVRQGLEFIGKFLSSQLGAKEKLENRDYRQSLKELQAQLFENMRTEPDFLEGLTRHKPNVLDLARGTTGALISHRGKITSLGKTPSVDQAEALIIWLKETIGHRPSFHTHRLGDYYPEASSIKDVASGVLCIAIPESPPSLVVWLKPEVLQTINWAGNPHKPVENSDLRARLSPRRSFALWQQTLDQQSLPWAQEEVEAAEDLRRSMIEVDLERQFRSAITSNQELDHFASIIAHDLKEPLRGIGFFADFLESDVSGRVDQEAMTHIAEIKQLTEKAKNLISELYEYSKLGRVELSYEEVNLNDTLASVTQRLKAFLHEHSAEVIVKSPLPTLRCDKVRISEVFANLITNAVKYNNSSKKQVTIDADFTNHPTKISVADNGIGIDLTAHERVFRMFERLHDAHEFGGGTGTGLAIVKRIVEMHSGHIEIESLPERGSRFTFTLSPEQDQTQQRKA